MTRAMSKQQVDAVIVGAGVAGLTAAWRLAQAGVDVIVVEARDRVGGRLHTVEVDGEPFELGGQWIGPTQSAVGALLDELGLELFARHREGDTVRLGADGRAVRYGGADPGLPADAVAAYDAGVEKLRRLVETVDPDEPWTHPEARALDAVSYEQWLQAEVPHAEARAVLRFVASGFMTKPADSFSLLQTLWLLSSAGAVEHLLDENEVLDARIVGGAQQIPLRLAERLGERVLLGAPVRDVAWSEQEVRVTAGDVEITAAAAVLAVPPNLLPAIRFDPPLPGRRMQVDQWLSQGALIKVQAAYPTPFWRAGGMSGTAFGHALVSEVYDNSPPSGMPGVLIGFISDHAADAAAALAPARAQGRGAGRVRRLFRPRGAHPDALRRARLDDRGMDARRVLGDVRDRGAVAVRAGAARADRPVALRRHRHRRHRQHAHGRRGALRRGRRRLAACALAAYSSNSCS